MPRRTLWVRDKTKEALRDINHLRGIENSIQEPDKKDGVFFEVKDPSTGKPHNFGYTLEENQIWGWMEEK